jgi:hypothetical protein
MRLLLDEMWTPTIAIELRKRGFDAIAANEPALASRYAGATDDAVFARAQEDGRTQAGEWTTSPEGYRGRGAPLFAAGSRSATGTVSRSSPFNDLGAVVVVWPLQ